MTSSSRTILVALLVGALLTPSAAVSALQNGQDRQPLAGYGIYPQDASSRGGENRPLAGYGIYPQRPTGHSAFVGDARTSSVEIRSKGTAAAQAPPAADGFHWLDAVVGGAATLAAGLLGAALVVLARRRRPEPASSPTPAAQT